MQSMWRRSSYSQQTSRNADSEAFALRFCMSPKCNGDGGCTVASIKEENERQSSTSLFPHRTFKKKMQSSYEEDLSGIALGKKLLVPTEEKSPY